MTAHAHHWHLKHYEHCVSRGTCQCGAIRFFADDLGKDVLKRVEEINRAQGKEGFIDMIDTNVGEVKMTKPIFLKNNLKPLLGDGLRQELPE